MVEPGVHRAMRFDACPAQCQPERFGCHGLFARFEAPPFVGGADDGDFDLDLVAAAELAGFLEEPGDGVLVVGVVGGGCHDRCRLLESPGGVGSGAR